jgi:hypothetical protein
MELTRNTPLSIIILQDWTRLFAQAEKSKLQARIQKDDFIEIQWEIVSTVKGNIRTIRDATDIEYYEFHVLDKLPPSIMEKMHSIIWKLYDNKVTNVTLIWLINKQKSIQDEEEYRKWWLTPQEKENRRKQVERMNQIMVEKWLLTPWDASRIIGKILTQV